MIYRLYQLYLQSDLPFPELPLTAAAHADIHFKLAAQSPSSNGDARWGLVYESEARFEDQPLHQVYRGDSAYLMRYADTGDFVISLDSQEILCHPLPGTTDEDIRACVLGPVLALYFHLQRRPVFHASAVVIRGRAAAFVDGSGGGKSTLAAAFVRLGYRLLTDDVLVIRETEGVCWGTPGYPVLRLWPEVIAGLFGSPDQFPRVLPRLEKRYVPVWDAFHAAPCPLGSIYLLDECLLDGKADIQPTSINPGETVIELVRNTYGAMWLESGMWADQFDRYCRIATEVPVRRVSFPRELSRLPAVCAAILDDFAT